MLFEAGIILGAVTECMPLNSNINFKNKNNDGEGGKSDEVEGDKNDEKLFSTNSFSYLLLERTVRRVIQMN